MSCGKKRVRKLWENYQAPRTVKLSKYELKDSAVKNHWKGVIKELEAPYTDETFWKAKGDEVHELVGDVIYDRLRKIFNLPPEPIDSISIKDSSSSIVSSAQYFGKKRDSAATGATKCAKKLYSGSHFSIDKTESVNDNEDETIWSESTGYTVESVISKERTVSRTKSLSKSASYVSKSSKLNTRSKGGLGNKSQDSKSIFSGRTKSTSRSTKSVASPDARRKDAFSGDDLEVHVGGFDWKKRQQSHSNPYYEMLYCNDSETDMIKWKSNYKPKKDQVSALDEFSKGIELRTKKIAAEFFEWWSTLGSKDYKTDLKKPADIEALFQLWFDEHASRALIKDRKILPCVLKSVAEHFGCLEKSQEKALERLIIKDIRAEAFPPDTVAFNASLPNKMKHYPPRNNTEKIWNCVKIPEDLRTMECVWGDIRHLRSTKSFEKWLRRRPHLPLPPVFNTGMHPDAAYLPQDVDLTLPFTHVNIDLKDVLSKLLE